MARFAFVQQGGASNEYYLWVHDTQDAAEDSARTRTTAPKTSDMNKACSRPALKGRTRMKRSLLFEPNMRDDIRIKEAMKRALRILADK